MEPDIPSLASPCVRANPDISGVGIRLSIYLQAFLNVACALIFSPNVTISDFEHSILSTSSRNLFLTGCALLICAFYQGSMQGLTVHHTLIVLNLNWIIYLSALLYVFIRACKVIFGFRHGRVPSRRVSSPEDLLERRGRSPRRRAATIGSRPEPVADADNLRSVWHFVLLPAAHLSALGFLGILLWTQVRTFGDQPECTPHTVLVLFGSTYSVLNPAIRRGSMAMYWIVAIPLLNVIVTGAAAFIAVAVMALVFWVAKRVANMPLLSWSVFALYSGIATISMLLVLFIANNELMIARGLHMSLVGPGEEQWTFGQMLALVSLVVHGVELVKMLCIWKADRGGRGWDNRVVSSSPIQLDRRD